MRRSQGLVIFVGEEQSVALCRTRQRECRARRERGRFGRGDAVDYLGHGDRSRRCQGGRRRARRAGEGRGEGHQATRGEGTAHQASAPHARREAHSTSRSDANGPSQTPLPPGASERCVSPRSRQSVMGLPPRVSRQVTVASQTIGNRGRERGKRASARTMLYQGAAHPARHGCSSCQLHLLPLPPRFTRSTKSAPAIWSSPTVNRQRASLPRPFRSRVFA